MFRLQTCEFEDERDYCNDDETIELKNVDAEINSLYLFTEDVVDSIGRPKEI